MPESGIPKGASRSQLAAYNAGREERVRRLEQELDSVNKAQSAYFGSESGLVRDENWRKAHLSSRDSRRIDALGKVLGTRIQFAGAIRTSNGGSANARYENGVITLALDGADL